MPSLPPKAEESKALQLLNIGENCISKILVSLSKMSVTWLATLMGDSDDASDTRSYLLKREKEEPTSYDDVMACRVFPYSSLFWAQTASRKGDSRRGASRDIGGILRTSILVMVNGKEFKEMLSSAGVCLHKSFPTLGVARVMYNLPEYALAKTLHTSVPFHLVHKRLIASVSNYISRIKAGNNGNQLPHCWARFQVDDVAPLEEAPEPTRPRQESDSESDSDSGEDDGGKASEPPVSAQSGVPAPPASVSDPSMTDHGTPPPIEHRKLLNNEEFVDEMSLSDYHQATSTFTEDLSTAAQHGFFDVQAGIELPTKNGDDSVRWHSANTPATISRPYGIEQVLLNDRDSGELKGRVTIVHHPVSPEFCDYLMTDQVREGLYGADIGGKKKARLVRISGPSDKEVFQYSNGDTLVASALPTRFETQLFDLFYWTMEKQYGPIEEYASVHKKRFVRAMVNQLQIQLAQVRDGGFGKHSDAGDAVCYRPSDTGTSMVGKLPKQDELQVITLVLMLDPNGRTEIVWSDSQGRELGRVTTGMCSMHIQGHGVQSIGVRHEVIPKSGDGWRWVISFRYTLRHEFGLETRLRDCQHGSKLLYSQRETARHCYLPDLSAPGVASRYVAPAGNNGDGTAPSKRKRVGAVSGKPSRPLKKDTWPAAKPTSNPKLILPGSRIENPRPAWETLTQATALQKLGEVGIQVVTDTVYKRTGKGGQINERLVTRHGMPNEVHLANEDGTPLGGAPVCPEPGMLCLEESIRRAYGLTSSREKDQTWHSQSSCVTGVILKEFYKNDYKGLSAERDNIRKGKPREGFWIGGSGGAANKGGAHYKDLRTFGRDVVSGHFPAPQQYKSNCPMIGVSERTGVVCIWGMDGVFLDGTQSPPFYFGSYQIGRYEYGPDDPEQLEEYFALVEARGVGNYGRWREAPHYKFFATPYEFPEQLLTGKSEPARQITLRPHEKNPPSKPYVMTPLPLSKVLGCGSDAIMKDATIDAMVESGFWESYVCSGDTAQVEDQENATVGKMGTRISVEEAVLAAARLSVSGAIRFRREHIVYPGGKAGLLESDAEYDSLGSLVRATCAPMPCRSYDVTTLYFIQSAFNNSNRKAPDAPYDDAHLADLLFASATLRISGRTGPMQEYADYLHAIAGNNDAGPMLPKLCDLEGFLNFVGETMTTDAATGRPEQFANMSAWRSGQFMTSLPPQCSFYCHFRSMITRLSLALPDIARKAAREGRTRWQSVAAIADIMEPWYVGNEKSHARRFFVASQIIADIEEVTADFPFGPVDRVHLGHGGEQGCQVLDSYYRNKSYDGALRDILSYLEDRASTNVLGSLGMEKQEGGGVVCSLTGRLITLVDAEHLACKIYILISYSRGTRASNVPRPSHPHCHPVVGDEPSWDKVGKVMASMIQNYRCFEHTAENVFPDEFRMPQELLHSDAVACPLIRTGYANRTGTKRKRSQVQVEVKPVAV